jgi:hypothetical protein
MNTELNDTVTEVENIIQVTDLFLFKTSKDNRHINEKNVNKIYLDMKHNGVLPTIIVTDMNYNVIDGQHRILAAKRLKEIDGITVPLSVLQIKVRDKEHFRQLMVRYNFIKLNWKQINWLAFYLNDGIKDYVMLDKFMEMFPHFAFTESAMIVGNVTKNPRQEEFSEGRFKAGDWETAIKWGECITDIQNIVPISFKKYVNSSAFIRGLITMLNDNKFIFRHFYGKIENFGYKLENKGLQKDYVKLFQFIYDFHDSDKNKAYNIDL